MGVRWNVNLNPIHLARPLYHVLGTLLHELAHCWQFEKGSASKPPHHNREFVWKCEAFGIPTNSEGHDLGVRRGSRFHEHCETHGVAFPADPASEPDDRKAPQPLLTEAPVKPKGSKLVKWLCRCEDSVPIRVARADLDVTCNRCHESYRPV